MPYAVYKLLHLLGVVMVLAAVAGVAAHAANGGRREDNNVRGMLGANVPGWAWAKLVIWLFFGASLTLPYRNRALAGPLLVVLPLLAAAAAWLALYKPF